MKQLKYICLLLFIAVLQRASGSVYFFSFPAKQAKREQLIKFKKVSFDVNCSNSKVKRKFKPKKPKGIPVIVPNIDTHNFHSFSKYADFKAHEVPSCYSLFVTYAHGKRGPPIL